MITIEERAAAGATLLDTERPGWEREINLDNLNLADCHKCVLGQLYGTFAEGSVTLDLNLGRTIDDGFALVNLGTARMREDYVRLLAAWRGLIKERL